MTSLRERAEHAARYGTNLVVPATELKQLLDDLEQAKAQADRALDRALELGDALVDANAAKHRAEARLKAVQDVLDIAATRVAHDTRYAVTSNRLDVIINGADIRRALDAPALAEGGDPR